MTSKCLVHLLSNGWSDIIALDFAPLNGWDLYSRYQVTRNGLRVKNVKKEAAGVYQCVILLPDRTNISKQVDLRVADMPDHLLMDVGKFAYFTAGLFDFVLPIFSRIDFGTKFHTSNTKDGFYHLEYTFTFITTTANNHTHKYGPSNFCLANAT